MAAGIILKLNLKKLSDWYAARTGIKGIVFSVNRSTTTILHEFIASEGFADFENHLSMNIPGPHAGYAEVIFEAPRREPLFSPTANAIMAKISTAFCD